jgi:site-specific recombinase XerD
MDDADLIDEFLGHLEHARGSSPATRALYAEDVRLFGAHLGRGPTLLDAQPEDVRAWLDGMERAGLSATTRARKLAALRAFYGALCAMRLASGDPTLPVPRPQCPSRRRLPRTREQIARLLCAPEGDRAVCVRDRAILRVLYYGALKVRELIALDVRDFRWPEPTLEIRGPRPRRVPLPPEVAASLAIWIDVARPVYAAEGAGDALFLPWRGRRFTRQGIWKLTHEWAQACGVAPMGPDDLRHAAGAHRLEDGQSRREVFRLLGHADMASMARYLAPAESLAG